MAYHLNQKSKIYVAGHRGMVGSAIIRQLKKDGFENIVFKSSSELDLTRQSDVELFFKTEKPEYVVLAAARVGGIVANRDFPTEFLYQNLMIASNILHASAENDVHKLLYLGSSCIYPRSAPQPLKEEYLLSGPLEKTNEAYAISKIAGLKLTEYYNRQYGKKFISAMPSNLYGPGDNYTNPNHSHVIPALIHRFHHAKKNKDEKVSIWGSGTPLREFLYVDDLAKACVYLLKNYESPEFLNVGSGKEVSILELSNLVAQTIGYQGAIDLDVTKPDGTPRKILDSSKINAFGWKAETELIDGLKLAYQDFQRFFS
jgi:GDP-L-fucose synthase